VGGGDGEAADEIADAHGFVPEQPGILCARLVVDRDTDVRALPVSPQMRNGGRVDVGVLVEGDHGVVYCGDDVGQAAERVMMPGYALYASLVKGVFEYE
ncbi:hypothetical protein, partial [Limnospira sp. PMC 1291.21]|uniref:hypothetical protein n=1 Tax=Limnospira sp. PMC 1291.21 TaxID=2981074 RepID=UPI0028ED07F6